MKKETRGRKPKPAHEKKSLTRSIRMTGEDYDLIKKSFGSIQIFFDQCLLTEKELASRGAK